jgi:hypothetical protein
VKNQLHPLGRYYWCFLSTCRGVHHSTPPSIKFLAALPSAAQAYPFPQSTISVAFQRPETLSSSWVESRKLTQSSSLWQRCPVCGPLSPNWCSLSTLLAALRPESSRLSSGASHHTCSASSCL